VDYDDATDSYILEAEPAVFETAKRIFPGCVSRTGNVRFKSTKRSVGDLNWLMLRYPLEVRCSKRYEMDRKRAVEHADFREGVRDDSPVEIPSMFNGKLIGTYQPEGVSFLVHRKRCVLADDVGCGKTIELLAALASAHAFPALLITPPNITTQWSRMIDVFMRFGRDMPSWQILRGLTPYEFPRTPITICHYGLLRGWGEKLREFGFRSLLLDEIHELRHADTKKYSVASDLAGMCDYVWGASATPIFGYGSEIWAVMNIIDYHCLGDSDSFTKEWCDAYDGKIVEKPDVLGDYLRREGLMLRRRKEDVMSQLPPKRRVVTVIDKDDDEYAQLIGQAVRLARGYAGIRDFHTRGQVARQIDQIARQATGISKAPWVADFVASLIESGERVLLYAHHHKVHDIITERLKKYHPVRISGRETIQQKDAALNSFAKGMTPIVQLSTRSTAGLDGLQGMGTCCVFGELDWSPAAHLQAEGRLHRHGMNTKLESLLCYYLVSDSGMDEVMQEALGLKVGQFVGLMGDKAETEDDREIASKVARKHLDSMIVRLQQESGILPARNGHPVKAFRKSSPI
jgi:SNF2 family DNA or RNA helicase